MSENKRLNERQFPKDKEVNKEVNKEVKKEDNKELENKNVEKEINKIEKVQKIEIPIIKKHTSRGIKSRWSKYKN